MNRSIRRLARQGALAALVLAGAALSDTPNTGHAFLGLALAAGLKGTTAQADADAQADPAATAGAGKCRAHASASATATAGDTQKHDEAYESDEDSAGGCSASASSSASATSGGQP